MGFLDELENLSEQQDTVGKIPGKPNGPITSSKELAKVTEKQVDDLHEKPCKGELGNEEVIESNFSESAIININEALILIDEAEDILCEGIFDGLKEKRAKRKLEKAEKKLANAKEDKEVYKASKIKNGSREMNIVDKRIAKAEEKLAKAKERCAALKCESQDTIGKIPGELKEVKSEKELAKVPMYQRDDIKVKEVKGELGNEEVIEGEKLAEGKIGDYVAGIKKNFKNATANRKSAQNYLKGITPENKDERMTAAKGYAKEAFKNLGKGVAKVAAPVAIAGAVGAGAAHVLKKRKAKKAAEQAQNIHECMIDVFLTEDNFYISNDDMDFLLEACDYDLSQDEIMNNILEGLQYNEDELYNEALDLIEDIDYLLEDVEDLLAEGKLERAERKLEKAKRTREEMEKIHVNHLGSGLGTGLNSQMTAASMRRGKERQEKKIKKLQAKVDKLREDSEEFYYEYDPQIMDIYMEATNYELTEYEICQLISETVMDDIEDGYHDLRKKNPALAGAVKGLAYGVGGPIGGAIYGVHKKRRAEREGKEVEKGVVGKKALKGLGYGLAGSTVVGLPVSAAIGAAREHSKAKKEREKESKKSEEKEDSKKSESVNTIGAIPGKPNGPITSSGELAKVRELQQVEELQPRFDQAPKGGKSIVRNVEEDDDVEHEIVEDERELGVQESVTIENIQVFTREQGEYFISESAFHACCESYPRNSQIDVLYAIAEAYNIDVDDIFFLEGEDTAKKRVRAKIERLKKQLKDTAPSSETAKDLRKRIKELKAKL